VCVSLVVVIVAVVVVRVVVVFQNYEHFKELMRCVLPRFDITVDPY